MARNKRTRVAQDDPIIVEVRGELLVWCQGNLTGPALLIQEAEYAAKKSEMVSLSARGESIRASLTDLDHPERAAAAMMATAPGVARLMKAPEAVWDFIPYADTLEFVS